MTGEAEYDVEIVIKNKSIVKDPEGETILRDLFHRGGYDVVKSARTGKLISLRVEATDEGEAERVVRDMCNELRIYNPVIHTLNIKVKP